MGPDAELDRAFDQLLGLSRGMAAAGHYEVAYHALMAAVHSAEDMGDTARLGAVAELLRGYQGDIDALDPPHRLSTRSAHGSRGLFTMGASSAEAVVKRL